MTANESRIYGALLTLASLMVITLVVMGAPAREKVKCEGYNLDFVIEGNRDTFRIGDPISIANATNNVNALEWLVSDLDSVLVGKTMREQSLVLVFTREGEKNIQLRINDREDCTTVAKRIFIMPHCSDGQQNGSETNVDCGGNCPPCEGEIVDANPSNLTPITLPTLPTCYDGRQNGTETGVDCGGNNCAPCAPSPMNNLPYATIVRIAGEPICQTLITFDCGISSQYNPEWSFDDTGSERSSGTRTTHKFRNAGAYTIRVYIGNTQVGQKRFNIGACSEDSPSSPPPIIKPPTATSIILPTRLNCKEVLKFYSTSTQTGSRLRWQVNGLEKTGENFYHTFEQAGTYTLKLYVGLSNSPADTRTFTVKCNPQTTIPSRPKDVELAPNIKIQFQNIIQKSKERGGKRIARRIYEETLKDASMCNKQSTRVIVNNLGEKTLDTYYQQLIDEKLTITEVRVKKNGNCIEKILINHHRK